MPLIDRSVRTIRDRRSSAFCLFLLTLVAGFASPPVAAWERETGSPAASRLPGFPPVKPPEDPVVPVLPGTFGPTAALGDEAGSGDTVPLPALGSPSTPRPLVPRPGDTWDQAAETRDALIPGAVQSPAEDAAAWQAFGVTLLIMLAIAVAAALWLRPPRRDMRPVSILHDRPHRRG